MTAFTQLRTTRKGAIGERIARRLLERRGWTVYKPARDNTPHPIDFLVFRPGRPVMAVDVKTYPRRRHYSDTGIDSADWYAYKSFSCPVSLIFVDEVQRSVYGATISTLEPLARSEGLKTYFPLDAMTVISTLTAEELAQLKST